MSGNPNELSAEDFQISDQQISDPQQTSPTGEFEDEPATDREFAETIDGGAAQPRDQTTIAEPEPTDMEGFETEDFQVSEQQIRDEPQTSPTGEFEGEATIRDETEFGPPEGTLSPTPGVRGPGREVDLQGEDVGLEAAGGEVQGAALAFESDVIRDEPLLSQRDEVRITREGDMLVPEVTEEGSEAARRRVEQQRRFAAQAAERAEEADDEPTQPAEEASGRGLELSVGDTLIVAEQAEEPSGPFAFLNPASRGEAERAQEFGGGLVGEFLAGSPKEERDALDRAVQGTFLPVARSALGRNPPDPEVTDQLTEGQGFLTEEQEAEVREDIRQRQEFFGVGEEAESLAEDVTDSEPAISAAGAVGDFPGMVAGSTAGLTLAADLGTEVGSNLPGTIREEGPVATGAAITDVTGTTTRAGVEAAREEPFRTAGLLASGLVTGFAAGRAIQAAPSVARGASIRARGGRVVDFEDVSDPPTTTGGLPGFTRLAQRDPEIARREFIEQAESNVIGGDEAVAFHARGAEAVDEFGGFGPEFEAPGGQSELPGLFQSADLSPLRVSGAGAASGISRPTIGLPRPRTGGSRILAERDVDVGITPAGTRREVGEFLEEDAPRSQSFIRAGETGPTPEQEVIAPPGSVFEEAGGVFGVRVGGRRIPGTSRRFGGEIVPGRLTRRADVDADDVDVEGPFTSREGLAAETSTAIRESVRRQQSGRQPFFPVGPSGFGTTTSSDGVDGTTGSFGLFGPSRSIPGTTDPTVTATSPFPESPVTSPTSGSPTSPTGPTPTGPSPTSPPVPVPPSEAPTATRFRTESDEDEDEPIREQQDPAGSLFGNPIATARSFLGLGDNPDPFGTQGGE